MKYLVTIAQIVVFTCAVAASQDATTQLHIHPVDESGEPVQLTEAAVYLDTWGGGQRVTLPVDDSGVRIPLDRSWLCGAYPDGCDDQFVEASILLMSDGFAPVVSAAFLWMGGVDTPGEPPSDKVEVHFLSGAWMHVEQGLTKEITVPFRRPVPRRLQFLNRGVEPVAGVRVRLSLLLARSNHCGVVEGELLSEGVSDEEGFLPVPDADAELAFEFTKVHHVLLNPPEPGEPMRFEGLYSAPLNTVLLRAMESRPLRLEISGSGEVGGLSLSACLAACRCGACCGTLSQSDAAGRIDIDEFYPEEYERLTLLDATGQTVWQSTPRTLPAGTVTIELPKSAPVLSQPVPLERPR